MVARTADAGRFNVVLHGDAAVRKPCVNPHAAGRDLKPAAVDRFESTPGGGVSGNIEGRQVLVGKAPFLESHGVEDLRLLEAKAAVLQQGHGTGRLGSVGYPSTYRG